MNIAFAWSYHNSTKHTRRSVQTSSHFLDWSNQPRLNKVYKSLEPVTLHGELDQSNQAALAAYAQHLAATGLTFYDDEVTEFFSPHAAGKSAIFLVALGARAANRKRVLTQIDR